MDPWCKTTGPVAARSSQDDRMAVSHTRTLLPRQSAAVAVPELGAFEGSSHTPEAAGVPAPAASTFGEPVSASE